MPRRRQTVALIILQETSTIVTLLVALGILHLRTAHSIYYALGATVAAFFAKLLKKVIKQPRPGKTHKKTYGMPSTHSASIGFLGTYLTLSALLLYPHNRLPFYTPTRTSPDLHIIERIILAILAASFMSSVWWSRIKLNYHTTAQVIVGAFIGCSAASIALPLWMGPQWMAGRLGLAPGSLDGMLYVVPEEGWRVYGAIFERVVEDLAFVSLEAWEARSLEPFKIVIRSLLQKQ